MISSIFIIGITGITLMATVTYWGPRTDIMVPIAVTGFLTLIFKAFILKRKPLRAKPAEIERLMLEEISDISNPPSLSGLKEKAARIDIKLEEYLVNLSKGSMMDQGMKALMEQDYKKAVELFGENAKTQLKEAAVSWFFEGNANYLQKEYNEAAVSYRKSTSFNPRLAKAWYNWGMTMEALGQHERAAEKYKEAQELETSLKEIEQNLSSAMESQPPSQKDTEKCQQTLELDTGLAKT